MGGHTLWWLLSHCSVRQIVIKGRNTAYYYGCRECGQSRDFLHVPGQVIAVLDSTMEAKTQPIDDDLRANYLQHRTIFDFDRVEIIQASDEDVERLVM